MVSSDSEKLQAPAKTNLTRSLDEDARYALMRNGSRLFKEADPFYRSLGLTGLQYNVLRVLEAVEEELPQQEIARRVLASRANITSLIDQLEEKGLVERHTGDDRRVKRIRITQKALDMLERTYDEILAISAGLMKNLSSEEKKELLRLVEKLEA
ncbi:MAG: MarR family transcriptional regulator [Nitrospinaceae bacterium]|jgi:MarR family transcriptional regulator, 2-MHQ and catechol-resistance regulon repressor|nr:MarR family transcriptional regulator [Nitrospinaceae bacterium]MBT3435602.1 MarR family transcriptional regulator [Nitrospinaceae bacterium]MBT3823229.1 MarR family transcriptional regulator [Nitrospinaceae bacterium]MBT4094428.1 MarR family transcriptional regulator [Nitrospinaceae bacterium]MBT4429223.1 MarR family transcriptional regulator [Nitrospinaceae bacterium]